MTGCATGTDATGTDATGTDATGTDATGTDATGTDATGSMINAEKLADYSSFSALIMGAARYGIYPGVSPDRA